MERVSDLERNMSVGLKSLSKKVVSPVNRRLRSWAIERAKKRILDRGLDIHSMSEDELEELVHEEEVKLKTNIQRYGMGAVMLALVGSP